MSMNDWFDFVETNALTTTYLLDYYLTISRLLDVSLYLTVSAMQMRYGHVIWTPSFPTKTPADDVTSASRPTRMRQRETAYVGPLLGVNCRQQSLKINFAASQLPSLFLCIYYHSMIDESHHEYEWTDNWYSATAAVDWDVTLINEGSVAESQIYHFDVS